MTKASPASPLDIGTVFEASQHIPMQMTPLMPRGACTVVVRMKATAVAVDAEVFVCLANKAAVRLRQEDYLRMCVKPEHTSIVQAYLEAIKAKSVFEVTFKHYL